MATYLGSSLANTFRPHLRVTRLLGMFAASGASSSDGSVENDAVLEIIALIGRNGGAMRVRDAMAAVCLTKSEFLDTMEDGIRRCLLRERDGAGGVELQLTSRGMELA